MLKNIKTYNPLSDYNKVIKKLNNSGVRPTKQRMVLAKLLFEKGKRHVSAEELYDEVKKDEGDKNEQELTLIESEKIFDFNKKFSTNFEIVEFRRNIITKNISLNKLVGKEFHIGKVKVKGINLCEPCLYLQKKLNNSNIVKEFAHKGGLRAQILTEGTIYSSDLIRG